MMQYSEKTLAKAGFFWIKRGGASRDCLCAV